MTRFPFSASPRRTVSALTALLMSAFLLAGCDDAGPGAAQAAPAAKPAADPALVSATEEMMRQIGVSPVGSLPITQTLRIAGRIEFDEQRMARIGANVIGRVTDLHATLGQPVKAGDLLAQLHSTELGTSQLAYLRARAQADLHKRNVERAQLLLSAGVIGEAELQKRQSELAIAEAEKRAAADQLRVQGMTPRAIEAMGKSGAINSVSQVFATAPGVVVERRLALGQVIQPADALFTIADLSHVWAVAQVPEQQISKVQVGQRVTIEVPALGNEKLEGKLVYVGDTVDPEQRTVTVRTELANPERRLKPEMLATMLIESRPEQKLAVPASAVLRENDEDHVLQDQGERRFRLVKVKLGPEHAGMRPVESGLKDGDRIVAEGAFHLNNERKRMQMGEQ
ncbi:membrane fusion protein, cobalt-zinc-cadmium efflux system [Noviherbaspirillum humi]|uniref:Membrane fusion protein, cobalt-zinc-cadmium efflux system n=1 Tax=Noviherbaspirillum humi TaxID=1688639 RepID=A0A239IRX7_9BURK|nr:efflux RND transporter periplasmic adaptor subunit [Noviherbaspirillum humi]SNS96317.1 membrane fusion protein, cobalt-zinc-cadmium efflux system [Noviherbaspirillum humi]